MIETRLALPQRSPKPLIVPCTCRMPSSTAAIVLAIYGAVVVSMADNLIKPLILQGQSNLHPLLALLSVLGGVKAMGPIGIVVGPMIVAFLQALLKMLQVELVAMGKQAGEGAK